MLTARTEAPCNVASRRWKVSVPTSSIHCSSTSISIDRSGVLACEQCDFEAVCSENNWDCASVSMNLSCKREVYEMDIDTCQCYVTLVTLRK